MQKDLITIEGLYPKVLQFSVDGSKLIVGGDGPLVSFDISKSRISAIDDTYGIVSFSATDDGIILLGSRHQAEIVVWDIAEERRIELDLADEEQAANNDHTTIAAAGFGRLLLLNYANGKVFNRRNVQFPKGEDYIYDLAMSPDCKYLAIACPRLYLYELSTRQYEQLLQVGSAEKVAFSPDGQLLASVESRRSHVILCNVADRRIAIRLPHRASAIAFSPCGTLIASGGAGGDGKILIWDIDTRTVVGSLQKNKWMITSLAFSPDGGTLASASDGREGGSVSLWDVSHLSSASNAE